MNYLIGARSINIYRSSKIFQPSKFFHRSILTVQRRYLNGTQTKNDNLHVYESNLLSYFEANKFQLNPEKQQQQLIDLKRWMEWVYFRERPLVAIDVEAWEKDTKNVTEIGIAIFDPQVLKCSILPVIKTYHLIVKEHKKLFNGRFVPDNKHKFMGGKSYELTLDEGKKFTDAIIDNYINERNGVLVGHHIESDIKWLSSLGVSFANNTKILDTAKLYKLTRSSGGTLRGVLRLVNIPHGHLHNAANDAYFTLLAALVYCDPNTRRINNLDTYIAPETSIPAASKSAKRKQRLFDNSEVISYEDGVQLYKDIVEEQIQKDVV